MHTKTQVVRLADGARAFSFDTGLAPYDLYGLPGWRALTSCLSPELAARLSPLRPGNICVLAEADPGGQGEDGLQMTRDEQELERRLQVTASAYAVACF